MSKPLPTNQVACLRVPSTKKQYNEQLFTIIAPKYDLVTRLLSCGRDQRWKQLLIKNLPTRCKPTCLDLAAGTGDLTFALARTYPQGAVIGLDLTPSMVKHAQKRNKNPNVSFAIGDMCHTKFDDHSFDIITGGYALRNAPDLHKVFQEIYRLLKPGGVAAFLDFAKPGRKFLQHAEYALLKLWGSLWGLMLHGNPAVYGYIAESLRRFPDRTRLRRLVLLHEFEIINQQRLFGGILELLVVRK